MIKILLISGSSRKDSYNVKLLEYLVAAFSSYQFEFFPIEQLPLFKADDDQHPFPDVVTKWREAVKSSRAIIICTPEYIYNIPAALKNALEWVTSSGEMMDKKVLPITFTPNPPRGEKAMESLTWSLQALKTNIVGQLDLYQQDFNFDESPILIEQESLVLLEEAIPLLVGADL